MLDIAWLCNMAIQAVYWLVLLACNFLGYSPVWVKRDLKKREIEEINRSYRVPHHLSLCYSDRKVNFEELIALIELCLAYGVRRVTVYDPWGDSIALERRFRPMCQAKNVQILAGCCSTPIQHTSRLVLQLLSAEAGRPTLVDACKSLSTKSTKITSEDVTNLLSDKFNLQDPDCLIMIGQTPSLAGYPPWCLRITEFIQLRNLPFTRQTFEECLESFSKRDIRVGK
ncbi:unnamed protein product [Auanema sp. JU1783]|nr:unnamed protein product [Auanema sp. JU1783]